jgi:hypothetical protein
VLKECLKTNRKFIDNDFAHEVQSVEGSAQHLHNIVWLRPHQIAGSKEGAMTLFDKIAPADIKHGYYNMSAFIAVLYALAEQPARVVEIFNSLAINS